MMIITQDDYSIVAIIKEQDEMLVKLGHLISKANGTPKCGDTAVAQEKTPTKRFLWIGQVKCQECRESYGSDTFSENWGERGGSS